MSIWEKPKNIESIVSIILWIAVFGPFLAAGIYISVFNKNPWGGPEEWAQFGDYFGGVVGPIIAFAAVLGVLLTIRIQREELNATRRELQNSSKAQKDLVRETIKGQKLAYATSLIPLIESERHELIALQESAKTMNVFVSGSRKDQSVKPKDIFKNWRLTHPGQYEPNIADPNAESFCQRLTDKLFSIFAMCRQIQQVTKEKHIPNYYLHVVGRLVLDLQTDGFLQVPSYGDKSDLESLVQWARGPAV